MVKETKTALFQRLAAENLVRVEEAKTNYLPNLMTLLERAQKVNFELSVENGVFVLWNRDVRDRELFVIPTAYTGVNWDSGYAKLERDVTRKENYTREETRKRLAKQSALAKLTTEERELLGV